MCADYFPAREAALKAHVTQVDPDGRWFAIPRQMQAQVWPTEDFELAASRIEVQLPEDDLFAGVVPGEQVPPGTPAQWRAPRRTEDL